jgi:hypothetical protein
MCNPQHTYRARGLFFFTKKQVFGETYAVSSSGQCILDRLSIPADNWLNNTTEFEYLLSDVFGAVAA